MKGSDIMSKFKKSLQIFGIAEFVVIFYIFAFWLGETFLLQEAIWRHLLIIEAYGILGIFIAYVIGFVLYAAGYITIGVIKEKIQQNRKQAP